MTEKVLKRITCKLLHMHEDLIICVCHLDFPNGLESAKAKAD